MKNTTKKIIIQRKLLHLGLLLPYSIYWYMYGVLGDVLAANLFLLSVLFVFFLYEYIRLDLRLRVPFDTLVKPKEMDAPVDGLNLVLTGLVIHNIIPFPIAVSAMLIGIIGDAFSTLGGLLGEWKVFPSSTNKATWEGIFLTLIVNLTLGFAVLGISWPVVPMAVSAIIIEAMVTKLDDNLVVPIIVGMIGLIFWYV